MPKTKVFDKYRLRNLLLKNDAKPLNDKGLHDNWTFKLLVARCWLLVGGKSNSFALPQNRRIYPPALWRTSLLFLIKLVEYLPARASQWQAGLILTSNQKPVTSNLMYC